MTRSRPLSRGARRTPATRSRRVATGGATAGAVAVLAAAALLLGACSRDSGERSDGRAGSSTTTGVPAVSADLVVRPGVLTVESAGPEARFDRHTTFQITKTVNDYLRAGVTGPFVHGAVGPRFASTFAAPVRPAVAPGQHDRAVLSDEGAPRITGPARTEGAPLDLTGLADQQGTIVMATARLGMRITGPVDAGEVTVTRLGDLVLEPTADGHWAITGYSMLVLRDDGTTTTTTVAAAGAANTPTTSDAEGAP